MRELRKEVRAEIKKAKFNYREKIEKECKSNNLRTAWNGMSVWRVLILIANWLID